MNWNQIYSILYDKSGKCKHSPENIKILSEIIKRSRYNSSKKEWVNGIDGKIDRWNLYNPDSIHIAFAVYVEDSMWASSQEVVVPFSTFVSISREFKLEELGI